MATAMMLMVVQTVDGDAYDNVGVDCDLTLNLLGSPANILRPVHKNK